MQCFQADEDMLLSGARVFQGSPPGKLTILLSAPHAEEERTVPHFFCDHASLLFPHTLCVYQKLGLFYFGKLGKPGYPLTRLPSSAWQMHIVIFLGMRMATPS
jgi:hypothetical protein